jgi:peptide/nickel transport system permease protein
MPPLAKFLFRRFAYSLLVVALALVAIFVIGRMIGDPVIAIVSEYSSNETRERVREELGFADPLSVQFVNYVGRVIRLDFGTSTVRGQPAMDLVLEALPWTVRLGLGIMILGIPTGLVIGAIGAVGPGGVVDRIGNLLALAGISVVEFWLGLTLILLVAIRVDWIPTGGSTGFAALLLPAATGAFRLSGRIAQFTRSALIEEYGKPYVEMARSKGISELRVFAHVAKNAAIPIVTLAGDEVVHFANGETVIEVVFAWPGLGRLIVRSIFDRDLFVLEAAIFVMVLLVVIGNLLVDLTYALLNPRLRYE